MMRGDDSHEGRQQKKKEKRALRETEGGLQQGTQPLGKNAGNGAARVPPNGGVMPSLPRGKGAGEKKARKKASSLQYKAEEREGRQARPAFKPEEKNALNQPKTRIKKKALSRRGITGGGKTPKSERSKEYWGCVTPCQNFSAQCKSKTATALKKNVKGL